MVVAGLVVEGVVVAGLLVEGVVVTILLGVLGGVVVAGLLVGGVVVAGLLVGGVVVTILVEGVIAGLPVEGLPSLRARFWFRLTAMSIWTSLWIFKTVFGGSLSSIATALARCTTTEMALRSSCSLGSSWGSLPLVRSSRAFLSSRQNSFAVSPTPPVDPTTKALKRYLSARGPP